MPAAPEILQAIADNELDKAFELANAYARAEAPELRSRLAALESNYHLCKSEYAKNKISFEEFSRHNARVSDALCDMFAPKGGVFATLNAGYHALTCNRDNQSAQFDEVFKRRKAAGERIQFYYLYGGRYQSHESLSKRLAQERSGMRRGLAIAPAAKVALGGVQLDVCDDLETAKTDFVTRICETFGINPNAYANLHLQRLDFIFRESSVLRALGTEDYTMCFIEISAWDKELVPRMGEWFVHEFCVCEQAALKPVCLFFFGVNYRETDERTPREIEAVLRNKPQTIGLPELTMVEEKHLEDWIGHYARPLGLGNFSARDELFDELLASVRARQEKSPRKKVPGKEHLLHMDDVEAELKRVIDKKNE